MTDLPAPLTPPECDLRGLRFMPLDTNRLLDSDTFALATGDEFKAALTLWCKAWRQVPAGSLPADDRLLASLSGAGPAWPQLRAMALRGMVLCSDGRFYHPVIAAEAKAAWKSRLSHRERAQARWEASKARKSQQHMQQHKDSDATAMLQRAETDAGAMQGTGTGTGTGTVESKIEDSRPAEPDVSAGCVPPQPDLPLIPPEPTEAEKKAARLAALEADFAVWYQAYPRHDARADALKAYLAARKEMTAEALLAAARSFRPDTEKRFIPLPASWLRGKRWLDETGKAADKPENPNAWNQAGMTGFA